MFMEKKTKGCTCKADLKKEVNAMVNQVEGYTKDDHDKKRNEVKAAFGEQKTEKK